MQRDKTPENAILIAWPQTWCKQAGAWYDFMMRITGINDAGFYKVGHAAIILINPQEGTCNYYDFGRYHAPAGHGRVRNMVTDHDLAIPVRATWNANGELQNSRAILEVLAGNPSCHGDGTLYAGIIRLDYTRALQKANALQERSPLEYGPFVMNGTNCSRFVRTVALAGAPSLFTALKLFFPYSLSPTPMTNVRSTPSGRRMIVPSVLADKHQEDNKPAERAERQRLMRV